MVVETGEDRRQKHLCLLLSVYVTEERFSCIAETANWWQKYLKLHLKRQSIERGGCMQETYRLVQ